MSSQKILVVITSHTKLIDNDHPTGWYLPELAHPYYILKEAGYSFTFASPQGGEAPLDQASVEAFKEDADCQKFLKDEEAQKLVKNTVKLAEVDGKGEGYAAIYYPGGHGPMFDLPVDKHSQELIKNFFESGRPVSAVCHAPAVYSDVKLSDGSYILKGRSVTSFTNDEEEQAGLTKAIPWLLETRLIERGAKFEKAGPWQARVVVDKDDEGRILISGQNPASSAPLAKALLKELGH
ncbi:unnamed protein product [Tilletia controversa]|uniref:D-lactate dehydratase n=1 Tax=Tilletia controversa TaxID=13291 RepID=A0A8X7N0C9_9BASI|nr:hypothetical protein CF328_g3036 [Tilletia controversa]KAE8255729.1 hypothetical protein A4X06_0g272 [Tilletia controversa]CAD6907956.1 unnamed protein product [Tilletia controversa]CAD6914609.1 unnamed protein product [Tilletia controversa]CAD6962754.1 unnamed protein product [Tilletia controversa]